MSFPATLEEALAAAAAPLEALLTGSPDRCSVVNRTPSNDAYGGVTFSDTTVVSDIPILYVERTSRAAQLAGASTTAVTHDVYLISSAATRLIQPDYKIVVAARDDIPQLTFENPVRLDESLSPLVHLGASLKP
jgi:hypothetical protein